AWPYGVDGRLLRGEHDVVREPLRRGKPPADRPDASDVSREPFRRLGADVREEQVAVAELAMVRVRMQDLAVNGDDGAVRSGHAVLDDGVLHCRPNGGFATTRPRRVAAPVMRFRRDGRGGTELSD